jgi:hypothetical protein
LFFVPFGAKGAPTCQYCVSYGLRSIRTPSRSQRASRTRFWPGQLTSKKNGKKGTITPSSSQNQAKIGQWDQRVPPLVTLGTTEISFLTRHRPPAITATTWTSRCDLGTPLSYRGLRRASQGQTRPGYPRLYSIKEGLVQYGPKSHDLVCKIRARCSGGPTMAHEQTEHAIHAIHVERPKRARRATILAHSAQVCPDSQGPFSGDAPRSYPLGCVVLASFCSFLLDCFFFFCR